MFYSGLAEFGVLLPTRVQAAEILKRVWAREVVEGSSAYRKGHHASSV
jgi:hypothetical protein